MKPELLGSLHEFEFDQCQITIELPGKNALPQDPLKGDKVSFYSYREVDGKKIPLSILVHSVDVWVSKGQRVRVPEAVLSIPPKAVGYFSESEEKNLDELTGQHREIAEKAFNL